MHAQSITRALPQTVDETVMDGTTAAGQAQAGFHVYASSSDRATLTARIEGDHHLMENILEL